MLNYETRLLHYDTARYPLAAMVEAHFEHPLTLLHALSSGPIARLEVGCDQQTEFHAHFYTIGTPFYGVYRAFVKSLLDTPGDYLYQKIPTFRVHLPGNVATGGFHRDADYNHPIAELNYLVPLTPMEGTSSVWIETAPNADDCYPVRAVVGDVLRFHGAVLTHGSVPNESGRTRVSFDFRILPKVAYHETDLRTVNQGRRLILGDYYADGGLL